jgi:hypothetical protein
MTLAKNVEEEVNTTALHAIPTLDSNPTEAANVGAVIIIQVLGSVQL